MSKSGQNFGFFIEALTEKDESGDDAYDPELRQSRLPWVDVPSSQVSYLAARPGKPPEVLSRASAPKARVGVLETIRREEQTYLMMLPAGEVRLNGLPAPPVAILRVGDQLRLGGDWLLYVSRFTRPHVGPPPEEYLGKPCSYCRIKFVPNTVTYVCPNCGTPLHCENQGHCSNEELGALECARLISECHHCHRPIVLEERHEYVPDS